MIVIKQIRQLLSERHDDKEDCHDDPQSQNDNGEDCYVDPEITVMTLKVVIITGIMTSGLMTLKAITYNNSKYGCDGL